MLPPSHLTNSNRSRSRSPHRSVHPYPLSMNVQNKSSSPPPPPSRKRTSPTVKSTPIENNHKTPSHFAPTFAGLDPLMRSMIERQRFSASAAYASLFGAPLGSANVRNNFLPPNLFAHLDLDASSAMSAAMMQREHFLNSLRTSHQEQILSTKKSTEESLRIINPRKVTESPGSHSSTSSPTLPTEHQKAPRVNQNRSR